MIVKNNYNECITNLACSIRKYFGLEYKHNTLDYVDKILDDYKPENVVTILVDGVGSNILDRMLSKDDFLIKNRLKNITTVFPATTVAATKSMLTGLNPCETGMLGWYMYYKDIDKTICVFMDSEKGDLEYKPLKEAANYRQKYMNNKTIIEEINEKGVYEGYGLFPFSKDAYSTLDEMYEKIENLCKKPGKKYIYAYDDKPDALMHMVGCDSLEVKNIIEDINKRIEKLSKQLTNTIIFVVADHGHHNVENILINDYPDVYDCLLRPLSLEQRAINFFVKPNKLKEFPGLFNLHFNKDFDLYNRKVIQKLI